VTTAELTAPNARALGIVPDISDPNLLPLGQGDAGIGFNSAFQFDFNPDDGISSSMTDFDSVASHEIGHALGFISDAGDAASPVTQWDLFRFQPAAASLGTFATATRQMSIGGSQVFFGNQTTTYATLELSLSTGGPDPGPGDGDGRQSSHWKDDALGGLRQYIGVMDPTLIKGIRRTISENDILAIDLFGYSIGLPAPVRPPNDNFANLVALQNNSGTLTGTNLSATRETGEPNHAGFMGDKSVWYSWLSPVNGQITVDTIGSNFDTTLAVYTGDAVNQLVERAFNDDIVNGQNKASRVQFNVTAGTNYRIAVDGWNSESGSITLNWNATGSVPTPTPTPTPSPSPSPTPTPRPSPPCLDDLWTPTSTTNAPTARRLHTAVWTGTEMIIWGGDDQNGNLLNTGARYDPATDSWTNISTTNAPAARRYHSAIWTGTEMIIWGGQGQVGGEGLNTGARYNPNTDSWTTVTVSNAPEARLYHSAVWSGSAMVIWGGNSGRGFLATGGRYNPSTDSWTPTSTTNAPVARYLHTAVWSGSELIVWGGFSGNGELDSGSRYNPITDSWSTINVANAPVRRSGPSAVWTGNEMIIWGGYSTIGPIDTGGRYTPVNDTWIATATLNAPEARAEHSAIWTGSDMIVGPGQGVGFNLLSSGRYHPATDNWIDACNKNGPAAVRLASVVWTGSQMIVWGGDDISIHRLNTGARYSIQGPIQLLMEAAGPIAGQAAALDSSLAIRDPFQVVNGSNVLNPGTDQNTRVTVLASNLLLLPGDPASSIIVNLVDSNNQSYDVPAEDARTVSSFVQVTFRLPNGLAIGTCTVKIKAHGQVSNAGAIRIKN
jgi:hypothetical protein